MDYLLISSISHWMIFVLFLIFHSSTLSAVDLPLTVRRPPRITKQPGAVCYVFPGANTTLSCEADANPAMNEELGSYFWKKDGKLFSGAQGRYMGLTKARPNGSIILSGHQNTTSLDPPPYKGKYQCFARNSWGTALSNIADVKIINTAHLVLKVEDKVLQVRVGDKLLKPCVDTKYRISDEEEVKWVFTPDNFERSNRIAEAPDRTIVFSNIIASDHGIKFYCSSKDLPTRITIESTHYTLEVRNDVPVGDMRPEIVFPKDKSQNVVALKGEDLSLSCIAIGKPTPKMHWNSQNRFVLHDFNRTLQISAVAYSDAGIYVCTAENEIGSVRSEMTVIVESKPYFANESEKLRDIVVETGEDVRITCDIIGNPQPTIQWMKNGEILKGSEGPALHLKKLREEDTAVYQCIGSNKHGIVMGQGFINVLESPPEPWSSFEYSFRKLEGTTISIPCDMFSVTKQYSVIWTKYNQPQNNLLLDMRIEKEEDNKTLVIRQINADDSGIYRCNATNTYGSKVVDINLIVLEKTIIKPVYAHYHVVKGNNLTMEIRVEKDSRMKQLRAVWRTSNAKLVGNGTSLTIVRARASDAGKYVFEYESELDKNAVTIELTVQDRPEYPVDVQFAIDPNNNYNGNLTWKRPISNFSPMKAYHIEVFATNDFMRGSWRNLGNMTAGGDTEQYLIGPLKPGVRYKFRVWAENDIGLSLKPSDATTSYLAPAQEPKVNPIDVSSEAISPDVMVITWAPVDPFEHGGPGFGYDVSWRFANNSTWKEEFVDGHETSFTIANTPSFTAYEITVRSSNNNGPGPEPTTTRGMSGEDIPLASPMIVKCKEGDDHILSITWEPVPVHKIRGIPTDYVIRIQDKGLDAMQVKEEFVTVKKNSDSIKLQPFTKYEISLSLRNGAGESEKKSVFNWTTKEGIPEAPENFEIRKEKLQSLELRWDEPTKTNGKIVGYQLNYQWEENGEIKTAKSKSKKRHEILVGLAQNTTFTLTLCAKTSAGAGKNCSTVTAHTIAPRKPEKPVIEVEVDQASCNVTWQMSRKDEDDGIPIDGFIVQHRNMDTTDGNWTSSKLIPASRRRKYHFYLDSLSPGLSHEIRVLAKNRYGDNASKSRIAKTFTKDTLSTGGVAAQLWFIIILCVAVLLVLVILVACFMRRRRGGKYPVSEKEEQLVKHHEAQQAAKHDYNGKYSASMPDGVDNNTAEVDDAESNARPRLRGDSVGGNSIEAFGSGTTRDYDEDGSFIDQYGLDQRSESKRSSPVTPNGHGLNGAQPRLLTEFRQEAV